MSNVKVKKLVAAYPEEVYDSDGPPAGELVIPKVTLTGETANQFIGIPSFKTCHIAVVADVVDGEELEDAATKLKGQYPGLPGEYLEAMIVKTAVAASELTTGMEVRVFIDASYNANLQLIKDDTEIIPVWKNLKP